MPELTRRDAAASTIAAGAAFGLSRPLEFLSSAVAEEAAQKGFHAFKVGDIDVTTVFDGLWKKPHDPNFIKNATVEETKAALRVAGLPDDHVTIPYTVTFVKIAGKTIMFNSGTGAQLSPDAGKLAANMQAAGIDAKAISTVLITHFHPDHIFGLMAKETNAQVYPDAEIVVPAEEYKFWTDPSVFAKLPERSHGLAKRVQATFPTWKNIRQIEAGAETAPGIRALAAFGHTPGHTVYHLGSGADRAVRARRHHQHSRVIRAQPGLACFLRRRSNCSRSKPAQILRSGHRGEGDCRQATIRDARRRPH